MQFTTGGDAGCDKQTNPGLWIHYVEQQKANFYVNAHCWIYEHDMYLDDWYSFEVNKSDGKSVLKVNGQEKFSAGGPSLDYSNVKFYLSDPWGSSAQYDSEGDTSDNWIEMKNLKIQYNTPLNQNPEL